MPDEAAADERIDLQGFDSHDARSLLLDPSALRQELADLRSLLAEVAAPTATAERPRGVSVIVPSFQGVERLGAMLGSVLAQDLAPELFEVIVILNGEDDGSVALLDDYGKEHPELPLRWLRRPTPSAGGARNLGLRLAAFDHVTFLDDDDLLQPRFLSAGLAAASDGAIAIAPIVDREPSGELDESSSLSMRIRALSEDPVALTTAPWALGFNACKFVPTALATRVEYRDDLASGEDLVYFASLLDVPGLRIRRVGDLDRAGYVRQKRANSISRREGTFGFMVEERLAAIAALRSIPLAEEDAKVARDALVGAQANFIRSYLDDQPAERERVVQTVESSGIVGFPWSILNAGHATGLAISYCFAPFSDTSAVVAAKAIVERREIVDVISNDMSGIRQRDEAVSALADRWIDQRIVVQAPPSFGGWKPITEFANKAVAAAERRHATVEAYQSLYTRALWVGSHVAGALFKLRHWPVPWTAEFSDPLRSDAEGNPRAGRYDPEDAVAAKLVAAVAARGFARLPIETSFDLVEAATFVLADALVFTNQQQLDYMLSLWGDAELEALVRAKATVRAHPVPPEHAYDVVTTDYRVQRDRTNIAYFGSFYANRGLGEVLVGMRNLPAAALAQVRLHIFCNRPAEVRETVAALGLLPVVHINPYLSYMEFLNATKSFDVLLVNDVERDDRLPVNPFLPSKYSDYLGSGRAIWALTDPGSTLSTLPTAYRTPIGDAPAVRQTLLEIVAQSES